MPTNRFRRARAPTVELDEGQLAFLRGEPDPPKGCDVMAWNRWAWLSPPWHHVKDPADRCPDGSPGPAELWRGHGKQAVAEWRWTHPRTPHPLIAWLGEP